MELNVKTKILYLILAICVIFSPVFSVLFINNNYDHDHNYHLRHHDCEHSQNEDSNKHDAGCPICLKIELSKHSIRNFKTAETALYYCSPYVNFNEIVLRKSEINSFCLSPINLKNRINS